MSPSYELANDDSASKKTGDKDAEDQIHGGATCDPHVLSVSGRIVGRLTQGLKPVKTRGYSRPPPQEPSPHPDPLPSHPMGAEREQQPNNGGYSKTVRRAPVPGFNARIFWEIHGAFG